jgi:hypothetical protein
MAMIEQEIDAVFLELDGEGRALGNFLDDLDSADADFVAAGSALFSADFAGDDDARLLREALKRFKSFRTLFERADALDDAGAIAKDGEEQLTGFAQIVEPPTQCDFLAVVLASLFDGNDGQSERFPP